MGFSIEDAAQGDDCDWKWVWYVRYMSVEDSFKEYGSEEILEGLKLILTPDRLRHVKSIFEGLEKRTILRKKDFTFLTADERTAIERYDAEDNEDRVFVFAYYTIAVENHKPLQFRVAIGDGGEAESPKTPYDARDDGAFSDLSDCYVVEDRR